MVLGILKPSSGSFAWFEGEQEDLARRRIGALLETPNFYPDLNADDNLKIVGHIKRAGSVTYDEILDLVQLKQRRSSKFRTFSLGMKQRLAIAAAMVGDPEVLVLDEPTNGLDPSGIADVRNTIIQIAARGKTVILASHILAEVEKVCSHVAILKNGRKLADGLVGAILSKDQIIEVSSNDNESLAAFLRSHPLIHKVERRTKHLELWTDPELSVAALNRELVTLHFEIHHLVAKKRALEEEFLEIVR